jgi:hypothetical protein
VSGPGACLGTEWSGPYRPLLVQRRRPVGLLRGALLSLVRGSRVDSGVSTGRDHDNSDEDQYQQAQDSDEHEEAVRGGAAFAALGAPLGIRGNRLQAAMANFPRRLPGCFFHRPCAHYTTVRQWRMPPVIIE